MTEPSSSSDTTPREPIQSTATFMPTTDENGRPLSDSVQQKNTVTVHFNPESLDITFTNSVQKGRGRRSAQVSVTDTTAKLSMEVIFDTTLTGLDVRTETNRLARMMDPAQQRPRRNNRTRKIPSIVIFKWGTILFEGYIDSYKETLDFFSAEGVPLRASITMSMTQQDRSFEPNTNVKFDNNVNSDFTPGTNAAAERSGSTAGNPPGSSPGAAQSGSTLTRSSPVRSIGSGDSMNDAVSVGNSAAAGNSAVARSVAAANGVENMRLPEVGELVFPDVQASVGFGVSLNASGAGVSLQAGGETDTLFSNLKQSVNASVGAGVSFNVESHFDIGAELDADMSLELGGSLDVGGSSSMSADVGVSADIELGIQFEE